MRHTYQVNVTRDDRWWMIDVPELAGFAYADGGVNTSTVTQARRLSDITREATDFICTVTDKAPSEVDVDVTITVDGIDVTGRACRVIDDREAAERHAAAAMSEARQLARDLSARGVAVRDVGDVLGVSFQRAQQLIAN